MKNIYFNNQVFKCNENESLLDSFFRNKIDIPFSCRNGTCQACLIQSTSGDIPTESQLGLSIDLIKSNHLLPCKCYPISDMKLSHPLLNDVYIDGKIIAIERLSPNIKKVTIRPVKGLKSFKTGQFINIRTALDNKIRSYSISNSYNGNQTLEINVQKIVNGTFSHWIFDKASIGDNIGIHYPIGECYNSQNKNKSGKLLIATGSGLGAVLAITTEILSSGFTNPVLVVHGVKSEPDLYFSEELLTLSKTYSNFSYILCVSKNMPKMSNIKLGYADEIAFQSIKSLFNWEIYLYGNPVMVKSAINNAKLLGCKSEDIFYDSFEYGENAKYNNTIENSDKMEFIEEKKKKYVPNIEMWNVLTKNDLINNILGDFYTKVLSDQQLSPFFKGVTKEHIIGKQYSFLKQVYTGKDCYFGDRPRNAHHWMIISDSLFDYREKLFAESCIKLGLKEPFLSEILEFDESFRSSIVKTRVWPRIIDGEIKPIKGFEELTLDVGSICNSCNKEIMPGESIIYHGQTGEIFCKACQNI